MYITRNTSPLVVKLFQAQFRKDFSPFLKLCHEELVWWANGANISWEEE
jgi:ketosteroid isomerase-like protein